LLFHRHARFPTPATTNARTVVPPQGGPRLSWAQLRSFQSCESAAALFPAGCAAFKDRSPSTISMTVLVIVEMFNALNAISGEPRVGLLGFYLFQVMLLVIVEMCNALNAILVS
jgi:hypothetical protein